METKKDDQYSDKVATKRMEDALRRALNTPHKTQKEMTGRPKPRPKPAASKPTKGT